MSQLAKKIELLQTNLARYEQTSNFTYYLAYLPN